MHSRFKPPVWPSACPASQLLPMFPHVKTLSPPVTQSLTRCQAWRQGLGYWFPLFSLLPLLSPIESLDSFGPLHLFPMSWEGLWDSDPQKKDIWVNRPSKGQSWKIPAEPLSLSSPKSSSWFKKKKILIIECLGHNNTLCTIKEGSVRQRPLL